MLNYINEKVSTMRGATLSFSQLKVVYKWFIVTSFLSSYSNGATNFIHFPKNPYYIIKGGTARFEWKYSVDKTTQFVALSPIWFYEAKQHEIGRDNGHNSWQFQITNNTCPSRLLKPTVRVRREDQATLVITNVTLADNGVYGCTLDFKDPKADQTDTVNLIVTETPRFTATPNATTTVTENEQLSITCAAVGDPSPTIKWINVTTNKTVVDNKKAKSIFVLNNVKRSHEGVQYRCEANNNPNEPPLKALTTIKVYYAPEIKSTFVERAYCIEDTANITVSVDGNPKPTITCKHGQEEVDPKVHFTNDDPYNGNYTCNVTNSVGSVTYVVQLIKTNTSCQPTKPTPAPSTDSVHPGIIAGAVLAAILLIVGVVIAIIFWRRRKTYKRDSTTSHNQTVHMKDLDDGEEQYATAQHANRAPAPKEEPTVQYAVVDKSKKKKKKQPGELIYADLDHEATTPSDRPPSDRRPTGSSDQDTVYADINRAQEETPRYGNLKQMDNM